MIYIVFLISLFPRMAMAEPNIPTVVLTCRLMLYSLVLIVLLEAGIIKKILFGLGNKQAFFISLKANLLTLLLVVPIVWGLWLGGIYLTVEVYGKMELHPLVANILGAPQTFDNQNLLLAEWAMVPVYFLASYYAEYRFSRRKLHKYANEDIKKAFFYANLASYLAIMLWESFYPL